MAVHHWKIENSEHFRTVRENIIGCMNFDAIMWLLPGWQGAGGESHALLGSGTEGQDRAVHSTRLAVSGGGPMHPLASGMEKMVRKKLRRIT